MRSALVVCALPATYALLAAAATRYSGNLLDSRLATTRAASVVCAASGSPSPSPSLTERIFATLPDEAETLGAGGQGTWGSLQRLDAGWTRLRAGEVPTPRQIILEDPDAPTDETAEFDVAVAGGNIGILIATALQRRGLRVAVIEAGVLRGRAQDWNASRKEIEALIELGVISSSDLAAVIGIEFNPMRCGFPGGDDVWLSDVLNVGVRPAALLDAARRRFEEAGGVAFERSPLQSATVRPGTVRLTLGCADGADSAERTLSAKLLIDAMGQRSPIVAQAREGARPDGVCVVVGTCARGFDEASNGYGDVIVATEGTRDTGSAACPTQYFWEAFPASSGVRDRTTYLFTYMDLDASRPSVHDIFEDYWQMLPGYQGVNLDELSFQRALFGLFVSYKNSPLGCRWDRVLQMGDASGVQSPLSFGGFGAITRHLGRLVDSVEGAVAADCLDRESLALVNPYHPNLRAAWLFQAAMRPPVRANWDELFISRVLVGTFEVMEARGEGVMRPFLQDVLRVDGLLLTIGGLMLRAPLVSLEIVARLGPLAIADWFFHFAAMSAYSALASTAVRPLITGAAESAETPKEAYAVKRRLEGWQYGSGLDYEKEEGTPLEPAELAKAKLAAANARAFAAAR